MSRLLSEWEHSAFGTRYLRENHSKRSVHGKRRLNVDETELGFEDVASRCDRVGAAREIQPAYLQQTRNAAYITWPERPQFGTRSCRMRTMACQTNTWCINPDFVRAIFAIGSARNYSLCKEPWRWPLPLRSPNTAYNQCVRSVQSLEQLQGLLVPHSTSRTAREGLPQPA